MEELLIDCCEKMINLLTLLKEDGYITPEEYKEHVILKQKFLSDCALTRFCTTTCK